MNLDDKWMNLAIAQAKAVWNTTLPNPAVGAVIVKSGRLIAKGGTRPAGHDHAEIVALKNARQTVAGATLYVTLEPCSHYGQTPPCTTSIIKSGITTVVIGCQDPNPQVKGKGIKQLKQAGIKVVTGVQADKTTEMYRGFFKYITKHRPFVSLKIAQSINGCIASADKKPLKITDAKTDIWTHNLRAEATAIMVGGRTAVIDNPRLDTRHSSPIRTTNPLRVIFNLNQTLDKNLQIFRDDKTTVIVFGAKKQPLPKQVTQYILPGTNFKTNFNFALKKLYEHNIHHLLVEAGAGLAENLLKTKLFDEFYLITTNKKIEDGLTWDKHSSRWRAQLKLTSTQKIGKTTIKKYQ